MGLPPERRVELLRELVKMGVPVYTYHGRRRVARIDVEGSWIVIHYDNGSAVRLHAQHLGRRKFVAVI